METHILAGVQTRLDTIDPVEVRALATRYGNPIYRCYDIETDEHLRQHRWRAVPDRRGEVVFAVRQPNGHILLHTKPQYKGLYRLPSGGVRLNEGVEEALFREIAEETGQAAVPRRFLGVLNCRFHLDGENISFVSYVFYLESQSDRLNASDTREIAGYQMVPPEHLAHVARMLRRLNGVRRQWGYWRSLSHDLVYRYLSCPEEMA